MIDYYYILEVPETATIEEIKKSFRRLALKYHPDKNPDNKNAESKFKLIAEAYEILSNDNEKVRYDRKRKSAANAGHKRETNDDEAQQQITPALLLTIFSKIRRQVTDIGIYKINSEALYKSLSEILTIDIISFLIASDQREINSKIIDEVCICCSYLGQAFTQQIIPKLVKLAGTDNISLIKIDSLNKTEQKTETVLQKTDSVDYYWIVKTSLFAVVIFIVFLIFQSNDTTNRSASNLNSNSSNQLNQDSLNKNQLDSILNNVVPSKYKGNKLKNGASPLDKCFGKPLYSGNATLTIKNGSYSDAIICLYSIDRNKTIRNEYISASSDFKISQIPQGHYKIRVLYGNDWNPELINQCGKKGDFESDINYSEFDGSEYFENSERGFTKATITLYTVEGGNASSSTIDKNTFFSK